jgi:hypothetical protein
LLRRVPPVDHPAQPCSGDKIEASAQDGVLRVLVPKAPEVHAKRIQVRAGTGKAALASAAVKNGA